MMKLSDKKIRAELGADIQIILLDETDSTNSYAKREQLSSGTLVCAASQTGGRGRRGKSFFSPEGGVYMTAVFDSREVLSPTLLTVISAAACAMCLENLCSENIGIKWVNDIFADGKKAVGILCEAVSGASGAVEKLICGIGINVNMPEESFCNEIRDIAGAVYTEKSREWIIADVYNRICRLIKLPREEIIAEYKKRLIVFDKQITYVKNGAKHTGVAFDINSDANLLVRGENGVDILSAGEISIGSGEFCT